ncbi:hypothetical protein B4100_1291 [Heyndrickxia coagulans]|nr:hypothetical protein B4100_1291 [Heyndrickxia coagulans]
MITASCTVIRQDLQKNKCKNNLFNAKINIMEVFQLFL